MGCSAQSVPSLSKVAIRSAGGTKPGAPAAVVSASNCRIARFDGPSFQDDRGSVSAATLAKDAARTTREAAAAQIDLRITTRPQPEFACAPSAVKTASTSSRPPNGLTRY